MTATAEEVARDLVRHLAIPGDRLPYVRDVTTTLRRWEGEVRADERATAQNRELPKPVQRPKPKPVERPPGPPDPPPAPDPRPVARVLEWAQHRIEQCRRTEDKFARDPFPGPGRRRKTAGGDAMMTAVAERHALEAVVSMLGGSDV